MNRELINLINIAEKELKALFMDRVVMLAKELISIPTINSPGINYERITSVLSEVLRDLGFDIFECCVPRDEFPRYGLEEGSEDRINIVAVKRFGNGGRRIHIHTHYDVVPLVLVGVKTHSVQS